MIGLATALAYKLTNMNFLLEADLQSLDHCRRAGWYLACFRVQFMEIAEMLFLYITSQPDAVRDFTFIP